MTVAPHQLGRRRRTVFALAAALVALLVLVGLPTLAGLLVDARWFASVGRSDVFSTLLWTRILLGLGGGAAVFAFLLTNLLTAVRLTRKKPPMALRSTEGLIRLDLHRALRRLVPVAALVIAIVMGLVVSGQWASWLKLTHAVPFGVRDPIFGRDVGFYVFELPVLALGRSFAMTLVVITLMGTAGIYLARGALLWNGRGLTAERGVRTHLSILGSLVFALFAVGAWLASAQLLYSTTGPVAGASYADVHAALPALRLEMAAAAVGAVLVLASATRKRLVLLWAAIGLYFAVDILGAHIYPSVVERLEVVPNEAAKEAPFIARNIAATRAAFGIDHVVDRELGGERDLTPKDVQANQATIQNIRLWDHQPLLDTFAQIQEIRTYYDFSSIDIDRYRINNHLRQVMLSPRELLTSSLPNRTWINERFTFTHGYGLTMGPVNSATEEGLPPLWVKDLPPVSTVPELAVKRPEIYFGEETSDYVFVRTKNAEFDYPSGDNNVMATYRGRAGVGLGSAITRLSTAVSLGSMRMLLSDDITPKSRVLLHRDIRERIHEVAPFLTLDHDPYMVVRADGRLAWIQDAYTTSHLYPYAQPDADGIDYVRNSVKIVVDAYDGTVDLYVADAKDPVLRTWRNVFPHMFQPLSKMPADLRAHLRYPEDLFRRQMQKLTIYHMDSPTLVYDREDQWQVPAITQGQSRQPMEPYYTIMRLPEERSEEFILMLPFTPKSKDNLAAWIVGRSDGDHLGQLVAYRFPKDRLVFGPQQIMNRINQDANISRQISLWDQRGSQAILGTLLVIPIEESLIYVCPLYLRSDGGRIPELKRVIVVYEGRIAMAPNLEGAIAKIFGTGSAPLAVAAGGEGDEGGPTGDEAAGAPSAQASDAHGGQPAAAVAGAEGPSTGSAPSTGGTASDAALRREAKATYDRAVAAERQGDWAGYGEQLHHLGQILEQLAPPGAPSGPPRPASHGAASPPVPAAAHAAPHP